MLLTYLFNKISASVTSLGASLNRNTSSGLPFQGTFFSLKAVPRGCQPD